MMDLLLKLNEPLHGLVQALKRWFDKLSSEICKLCFKISNLYQIYQQWEIYG